MREHTDDDEFNAEFVSAMYAAAKGKFGAKSRLFVKAFGEIKTTEAETEPMLSEQSIAVLACMYALREKPSKELLEFLRALCLMLTASEQTPYRLKISSKNKGRRRSLEEAFDQSLQDAAIADFVLRNDEFGREAAVSAAESEFSMSRSKIYEALQRVTEPKDDFIAWLQQTFFNTLRHGPLKPRGPA